MEISQEARTVAGVNFLLKRARWTIVVLILTPVLTSAHATDPQADLSAHSVFKDVNLSQIAGGEMLAAKGPVLKFERGLNAETCFIVRKPIDDVIGILKTWTPTGHRGLNVAAHGAVANPASGSNFAGLKTHEGTLPTTGGSTENPVAFWTNALKKMAAAFQSGGLGALPPYASTGKPVTAKADAGQLLRELPGLKKYFAPIIGKSGLSGRGSGAGCYWELVVEDAKPELILGAVTTTRANGGWQALDLQYYATGGFYVGMTFYQLWPVRVGETEGTLIWRCNAVSAPEVATLKGIERRMAGVAYKSRVRKYAEALEQALSQ